ncbi:two-component system histidine kinase PnpS [Candidatus Formimonas warabiya]|uniref:histidine kinase n=1 Tax=Formimonas warabiya TaxID=1761012 RepID=A0A3G1KN32_FORW1|nr:ATP-binding protein [Candidatus Formimonas warabiya]ATW23868.1 hypothetical protein DCMF_02800 [Candidatus Formimonas warabiya]
MLRVFRGIRGRIISTYLFLILISMAVLGITLIWMLQNYLLSNLESNMANQAGLVSNLISDPIALGEFDQVDAQIKDLGRTLQARITIVLPNGKVVGDSQFNPSNMENHGHRPEIQKALHKEVGEYVRVSSTAGLETMYVAVPIEAQGQVVGVARISHPLQEIKHTFLKLRGILFTGIIIATFIAVLLSLKLAKGFTEPIESISAGARKITAGDLDARVYSSSRDELGELGSTINYMTQTLKEHIDEISQEKSRLENILHTMVSGVVVLDNHGLVRIVNPAAEEMFGISAVTSEGKHNLEVIRHFGLNNQIEKCLISEKIIEYEFSLRFPEERVIQCYIAPVYRDKKISGITLVFHDITKLRKLEQMRADFVANASHELRTPLTVIKGYVETLLNGALDDRQVSEKFVTVIDEEADRLKRLVDELLTLSQLESNRQEAEEPVLVLGIITLVAEEMRQRFQEKQIALELNLPGVVPQVKANPDRVKQILVNLLDNALKYTPYGGRVTVGAEEEENFVRICVQDTGMGIPSEDLPRIFERFYRVDKARSRQMGGFGLGLSIVKHMVENMGGSIRVESTLNEGSTFWFTLPKYEAVG